MGVPYQNLTAMHIWEIESGVDYREDRDIERCMRLCDGSIVKLVSRVHDQVESHPGSDFNRFGERMETVGKVHIGCVGNAVSRFFSAEDGYAMAKTMFSEDKRAFLKQTELITPLTYGHTINNEKGTQCVVDPENTFTRSQSGKRHNN